MRLFRPRTVPMPTPAGWTLLLGVTVAPAALWWSLGESFLSVTDRADADVLIVEAWTHEDGANAAYAEFTRPGAHYRCILATGGLTGEPWYRQRWDEVEIVRRELARDGLPERFFVGARAPDAQSQRTFANAVAAKRTLDGLGMHPTAVNVLTRGVHARRSRREFEQVFGPDAKVGVIAWIPPGFATGHWWQSSQRAIDYLKESAGYFFELLLRSGRPFRHSSASADGVSCCGRGFMPRPTDTTPASRSVKPLPQVLAAASMSRFSKGTALSAPS